MRSGLTARSAASPIPIRSTTPGRWFCTNRSARATSRLSSSRPRGSRRFSATERLLRLITAKAGATPRFVPPIARVKSPIPRGSTLITSAPSSPRIIVAIGPERFCVRSTMRIPLNGPFADLAGDPDIRCCLDIAARPITLDRRARRRLVKRERLAEGGNDLFGDRFHVLFDIVVAAGPTEHHGACTGVDVFAQALAAILRAAIEHVAAGDLGEVLRVILAEGAR